MKKIFLLIVLLFVLRNQSYSQKIKVEGIRGQPFLKYSKIEKNDTSTFYLSESHSQTPLPLIIYIQGSGNTSLFINTNGKIIPQSGFMTFFDLSKDRFRILVIEKPGVNFLQNDSDNPKFDNRFSLQNWSALIINTVNDVLRTEKIDSKKIMIVGHSEGGLAAATVAEKLKNKISHITLLAGEGVSQLYSLYRFAEEGVFFNRDSFTKEQRLDSLIRVWTEILQSPNDTDKKFWGFTYLRWSGFLQTSVLDQLLDYDGNILIIQGTEDKNVYPESAKILYTSLLSKGKKVQLEMIQGADHSFNITTDPNVNGWEMTVEKSIEWFLK